AFSPTQSGAVSWVGLHRRQASWHLRVAMQARPTCQPPSYADLGACTLSMSARSWSVSHASAGIPVIRSMAARNGGLGRARPTTHEDTAWGVTPNACASAFCVSFGDSASPSCLAPSLISRLSIRKGYYNCCYLASADVVARANKWQLIRP